MNAGTVQLLELCSFAHIPDMNHVLERIQVVCERFELAELSVFGSVSRGTATTTSDIDLLYRFSDQARPGFAFFDLEDELRKIFGRRVDLLAKDNIPSDIRDSVLSDSIVIYEA
jgi:predicted nucleotidyltransferase